MSISLAALIGGLTLSEGLNLGSHMRANQRLIRSNEGLAKKAAINQFKIAEMQIRNLQEIAERKELARRVNTEMQIAADEQLAAIGFQRQLTIEALKIRADQMGRELDWQHREEMEQFRRENERETAEWRLQKEQELRRSELEEMMAFQRQTNAEAYANAVAMVEQRILKEQSWPLINPSVIYLQGNVDPVLVLLSPPVITDREAEQQGFPLLEGQIARMIQQHVLPFTGDVLDLDTGAWREKAYRGNASLKPLAQGLIPRAILVIESQLEPSSQGGRQVSLSIAVKLSGLDHCSYSFLLSLPCPDKLEDHGIFALGWSFIHCYYLAYYTDRYLFQQGKLQAFSVFSVLRSLLADPSLLSANLDASEALQHQVFLIAEQASKNIMELIHSTPDLNNQNSLLLIAAAEDYARLEGSFGPGAKNLLQLALEFWALGKMSDVSELLDPEVTGKLASLLQVADRDFLAAYRQVTAAWNSSDPFRESLEKLYQQLNQRKILNF